MIEFNREEEVIKIRVTNSIGCKITTEFRAPSEMYAILLSNAIHEKMDSELERIRREAYEQGWNDHKKRKPKATWFRCGW